MDPFIKCQINYWIKKEMLLSVPYRLLSVPYRCFMSAYPVLWNKKQNSPPFNFSKNLDKSIMSLIIHKYHKYTSII
jgi:hypothetical protein